MPQAPLHGFMPGGVEIPLTLFTSETALRVQWCSALLAGLAVNVSRITPDPTAPNPRVCRAISTLWKLPVFHSFHPQMSWFLPSISKRHNLSTNPPVCISQQFRYFSASHTLPVVFGRTKEMAYLRNAYYQCMRASVVSTYTRSNSLQAWEGAMLIYAGLQAAQALLLDSSRGEYVRLCGTVQEQEVLCGTTSSSAGLPISLVTCGWSNSFIHAASRRNSSMSVEVKMSAGKKVTKFSSFVGGSKGLDR